jgi:hypothetical protein
MELTLVDVGQDTALSNGDVTEQLVQLLIVPDGELQMSGNDTGLLVVTGSVTSQLENFGSQVLQDGSQVDGSTGTDTLSVVALAEQTVDTTNGESQTGLGRATVESESALCSKALDVIVLDQADASVLEIHNETPMNRYTPGADPGRNGANRWETSAIDLRLRVLGTAGLAAGFAASSHFDGIWGELKKLR